jgi:hypothetical protein
MSLEKLTSLISRVFFVIAFVLLGVAVIERVANVFDYTILRRPGGRLLEFAVVFLVFVIALQLREVREAIRRRRPQG